MSAEVAVPRSDLCDCGPGPFKSLDGELSEQDVGVRHGSALSVDRVAASKSELPERAKTVTER